MGLPRDRRYETFLPARLEIGVDDLGPAPLVNISSGGARAVILNGDDGRLVEGQQVTLAVGDPVVRRQCTIRWNKKVPAYPFAPQAVPHLGLVFEEELSKATLQASCGEQANLVRFPQLEDLDIDPQSLPRVLDHLAWVWGHESEVSQPLRNIIERMVASGCTRIVLQHRYFDPDYHEEYLVLYHALYEQPRFCKRLFFFKHHPQALTELLGAVVLRPFGLGYGGTALGQVGRSFITPPKPTCYPSDVYANYYLTSDYSVFALERRSTIKCFPFLQQDALGARCAQVALHVAAQYLNKHININKVTPAEVREQTALSSKFPFPIEGLDDDSIQRAMTPLDCAPVYYSARWQARKRRQGDRALEFRDFVEVLHAYIDSQLPVILGISRKRKHGPPIGHAVCVVGHTISRVRHRSFNTPVSPLQHLRTNTMHVRDFIVHDDMRGPYLLLPIHKSDNYTEPSGDRLVNESLEADVDSMFVPLPPGVHLTAEAALTKINAFLGGAVALYGRGLQEAGSTSHSQGVKAFMNALEASDIIATTYLDLSNRFKANLLSSPMPDEVEQGVFRELGLPQYVWVAELTTRKSFESCFDTPQMKGYLLLDATASPSFPTPFLVFRFPGLLGAPTEAPAPTGYRCFSVSDSDFGQLLTMNFESSGFVHRPDPKRAKRGDRK